MSNPPQDIINNAIPPELLHSIFSYLSEYCLRHIVSYVCQNWKAGAQKIISRTVHWSIIHPADTKERAAVLRKLNSAQALTCEYGWKTSTYSYLYRLSKIELERLQELVATLKSISSNNGISIKSLVLLIQNATPIWDITPSLLESLGATLTSLQIYELPQHTVFNWRQIFKACPSLLHLKLCATVRLGEPIINDPESNRVNNDANFKIPLRTCSLEGLFLTKESLYPFLQACSSLYELRLVRVPLHTTNLIVHGGEPTEIQEERVAFFRKLPEYLPQLRSFHYSSAYNLMRIEWEEIPSTSLHNINSWSFGIHGMQHRTFSFLRQIQAESCLTSLEILGVEFAQPSFDHYIFMPYDDSVLVGDLLHAFLCQSPHLLHLKAEGVNIQLNLLNQFTPSSVNADRVNADSLRCDGVITSEKYALWACRNLKTLHLQFDCRMRDDRKSDNNSRKLFGYISRVCPKLEDLSIRRKELTLGVRSGFCLLSNLSRLRQLRISVLDEQELGDGDLDWIKREYHYSSQQDNCSLSELRLMEMISKEEWAIAEEERQFRELEKLHQKYNIPINQGDIPLSLRDAQLNKPGGNAITKKQTSTSLLSKIRSKMFKDSASTSIEPDVIETSTPRRPNIVDGIDMQNWGEDSDLLEYFKKRKVQRDVSLWSVMEFLEIRMGASTAYRPPTPTSISLSIKKHRPDIEVISLPNTYIPHIYIRRVDL